MSYGTPLSEKYTQIQGKRGRRVIQGNNGWKMSILGRDLGIMKLISSPKDSPSHTQKCLRHIKSKNIKLKT